MLLIDLIDLRNRTVQVSLTRPKNNMTEQIHDIVNLSRRGYIVFIREDLKV